MSLKPVLDNLEGLDETTASFYEEQDGKFRLMVEGGFKTHDEINGLTSALNKERDARGKLEKQLKKFDKIADPEEAAKAMETLKNLDAKKLMDAGEVEKVKEEVRKAMQEQADGALQSMKDKITDLETLVTEKDNVLNKELIGGRFSRSKFISEKMAIPSDLVQSHFGNSFRLEEDKVVAYDPQGNKLYSKEKPGELADFDEALTILVNQYPYKDSILKGSNASGPGITGGSPNPKPSGLEDKYAEAQKRGDVQSMVALKRQMTTAQPK